MRSDYNYVLAKKYAYPSMVQVLDEITRALPDEPGSRSSTSRPAAAARMCSARCTCAASPPMPASSSAARGHELVEQAAQRSPTTKVQGATGEVFDLGARLRALPPPAAGAAPLDSRRVPSSGHAYNPPATAQLRATSAAGRRACGNAGRRSPQPAPRAPCCPGTRRGARAGNRPGVPRCTVLPHASAFGAAADGAGTAAQPAPGRAPPPPAAAPIPGTDRSGEAARLRRRPPNRHRRRQPLAMRRCRHRRRRTRTNRTDGHARPALAAAAKSRMLAVGLLVLAVLLGLALLLAPFLLLHRHYDRAIEATQDHLERYRRVAAQTPEYRKALEAVRARDGRRFFLHNTAPNLAGAELQDLVRAAIENNAGRITTIQTAQPRDDGRFRQIGINVQLFATTPNLQKILFTLETQMPYVLVESITIRPLNAFRGFKPAPGTSRSSG